jgi:osmotically-inducible protein OsmY
MRSASSISKAKKFVAGVTLALILAAPVVYAESAGQYVDDATITTKVKSAIMGDSQLKVTQINVTTNQGTVNLKGAVDSTSAEARAVNLARQVDGVKSVQDNLTVRGTAEDNGSMQ